MTYYRLSFFDIVMIIATKGFWVLFVILRGGEIVEQEDESEPK